MYLIAMTIIKKLPYKYRREFWRMLYDYNKKKWPNNITFQDYMEYAV
jgi:hypothetical protein